MVDVWASGTMIDFYVLVRLIGKSQNMMHYRKTHRRWSFDEGAGMCRS